MIDLGTQDLAQRLLAALRLRGKVPLKLDETLIPVALASFADREPYRQQPVTWSWPFSTTGDATHIGSSSVRNVVGSGGVIVIRAMTLWTTSATTQAQWGVSRNDSGSGIGAGVSLPQACNQAWSGAVNSNSRPPLSRFAQTPTATATFVALGQVFLTLNVPIRIELLNPINIYPGDAFNLASGIVNTLNVSGYIEGEDYVPLP